MKININKREINFEYVIKLFPNGFDKEEWSYINKIFISNPEDNESWDSCSHNDNQDINYAKKFTKYSEVREYLSNLNRYWIKLFGYEGYKLEKIIIYED